MRHLLLCLILSVSFLLSFSQNTGIGIGTTNPHQSAEFEVNSSNRGFLPPRMTFNQRNKIINPAQGLIIYCTDCDSSGQAQVYNGIQWTDITGGASLKPLPANLPNVIIGTNIWQSKNLNVAAYRNGDPIPQVTNSTQWAGLTTGAWCWYNNDSASYANTYGRLYNWYAVADPRGLCSIGWHVPSDSEWIATTTFLGGSSAGGALKSTSGWVSPNTGATNSSGFTALPGGFRSNDGLFYFIGLQSYFWSSSEANSNNAWFQLLRNISGNIDRYTSYKQNGKSVRCVKDQIPSLTTASICDILTSSAICGGNVKNGGGALVTARGVVWSTSPNPTVSLSTKTADSSGTGIFTSSLTGLYPNTLYYVRAYATNSVGTAYGDEVSFTTTSSIKIGTQTWQSKNLDVNTYRNCDPIPQVDDPAQWANLTTGAWCWYNNDSAVFSGTYGRLYNWYAVADPRGLCPTGWHVASSLEWDDLSTFLGGSFGALAAGGKMKTISGWASPNTGATNSSGFSGLPAGSRDFNGNFSNISLIGSYWTSSAWNSNQAMLRSLFSEGNNLSTADYSGTNFVEKRSGFSVRCIKD